MEVMEQWKAEEEVEVEEALEARWPPRNTTISIITTAIGNGSMDSKPANMNGSHNEGGEDETSWKKSVYLDKSRVAGTESTAGPSGTKNAAVDCAHSEMHVRDDDLDVKLKKILSTVINQQDVKLNRIGESEEEIIELEFEMGIQKLDTHKMYCPNCNNSITKVILRRKLVKPPPRPIDCYGCLSCFTFFIPRGDQEENESEDIDQKTPTAKQINKQGTSFILSWIFGNKIKNENPQKNVPPSVAENENAQYAQQTPAPQQIPTAEENSPPSVAENENEQYAQQTPAPQQTPTAKEIPHPSIAENENAQYAQQTPTPQQTPTAKDICPPPIAENENAQYAQRTPITKKIYKQGNRFMFWIFGKTEDMKAQNGQRIDAPQQTPDENMLIEQGDDDVRIQVEPKQTQTAPSRPKQNVSKTLEILKSIVYGGLMESIASLSIVSSAAAADATTLNIVALGLANLIGGLFIIVHNIRELKNDPSGETSSERNEQLINDNLGETSGRNEQADQYQQLLGRRDNFLLHATVAMLSFLVFGLIPPLTYGFSFRKSDDRDLKIVVVAAASLLCIAVLAFGEACIRKPPKFYMYIKTVLYYISTAIAVSGVSYAIGDLIQKFVQKLGWFESSTAVTLSLPEMGSVNPGWDSY